jgi:hypothetical protein
MQPNAFINQLKEPAEDELTAALGPAKPLWDRLVHNLADEFDVHIQEWKSYSPKYGWSLRLKHKKRNIVYLVPYRHCFGVMFILGDRAVKVAVQSRLPQRVLKIINEAPRYPEGTGVRLEVKTARDIAAVKKLAGIKLEN